MRIAGVDIPDNKKLPYSLRYIYGIGPKRADEIVARSGVDPDRRVRELTEEEVSHIRDAMERGGYVIEGDLRREVAMNIRRSVDESAMPRVSSALKLSEMKAGPSSAAVTTRLGSS